MQSILETGIRQILRRLFGADVEAFILDDDWQGLLFVPDFGADQRVSVPAEPVAEAQFTQWPYASDAAPAAAG
jgi:hypothetical protein